MQEIPTPRGMRDLMPNEAFFMNKIIKKIESVYSKFGFQTIDTPLIESLQIMNAKNAIGEDTKLIFELKQEGFALRFDQTISLARYLAMYKELPMPFKRYVIGKSWRRDEPQKLRYREFIQADVDIAGSTSLAADAEVIAVQAKVIEELNLDYIVKINDRRFIYGFFSSIGINAEQSIHIMRAIDKLDKIGKDGVLKSIQKINGIDNEKLKIIDELISQDNTNEDVLAFIKAKESENKLIKVSGELIELLDMLKNYNLKGIVKLDLSLMRGIDYYNSTVVEYYVNNKNILSAIGGGGRYDNLVATISNKKSVPLVGTSLGISRILDILNFSDSLKLNDAEIFVVNVKKNNYMYALQIANKLRSNGIAVDMNIIDRNISNQFSYANSLKYKYIVIVGDIEEKLNNLKVRNLIDGTEETITLNEAIEMFLGHK
ncbi:MAG: histidine--tRNA ligase [Candidatus Marsarchaeota archaeon]|jgi:histidyl-tRNA synthetase|nr:histidine--tRNA ligase [Candidatus Marsarchaeota archaeon]